VNPIAAAQALLYCVAAFVLGAVLGAVPMYFYAHAKGEATHLEAIGSLKGTVDSCNVAAAAANAAVETERQASADREARVNDVLDRVNPAIAAASAQKRTAILTKPIHGATDCEQLNNAVNDHFRGSKP
jgi:hypothetical protein